VVKNQQLFQPPKFIANSGTSYETIFEGINSQKAITLDRASVASILSFGFVLSDRTIVHELERSPWLSSFGSGGNRMLEIPQHGRLHSTPDTISKNLLNLLLSEAEKACYDKGDIYILLSGGLDSRIVAGVFSMLRDQRRIKNKLIAVSWGLNDSRDVIYARKIAQILKLDWEHIPLTPESILENIGFTSEYMGCMIPPVHMHKILALRSIAKNSLVVGGSYGDSIGRAEFSGKHLLELNYFIPNDLMSIMDDQFKMETFETIHAELLAFRMHTKKKEKYAIAECEQQAHYMRSMLAPTIASLNDICHTYQMFTSKDVYGYMWSLHPAVRNDKIYSELLRRFTGSLLSIPWARTNEALDGSREHVAVGARKSFHKYRDWISNDLFSTINDKIDRDLIHGQNIFKENALENIVRAIKKQPEGTFQMYDMFTWLASLSNFLKVNQSKLSDQTVPSKDYSPNRSGMKTSSTLKVFISNRLRIFDNVWVVYILKHLRDKYRLVRKVYLLAKSYIMYPIEYDNS
jgi:hypothetical protein